VLMYTIMSSCTPYLLLYILMCSWPHVLMYTIMSSCTPYLLLYILMCSWPHVLMHTIMSSCTTYLLLYISTCAPVHQFYSIHTQWPIGAGLSIRNSGFFTLSICESLLSCTYPYIHDRMQCQHTRQDASTACPDNSLTVSARKQ